MSDIFEQLITGNRSDAPQAELLEALGKKAAAQYLQSEASLNESIVKLASQHANLNNEHIKRIAEFANNAVFQGMHSRSDDKNVHFPVADPGTIIQDLRDGGSPAHDGKTLNSGMGGSKRSFLPQSTGTEDYQTPPNASTSAGFSDTTSGMAELDRRGQSDGIGGTGEPLSKEASFSPDALLHSNPVEDVFNTHIRLRATREKLAEDYASNDFALNAAQENFYQEAKRVVLAADGPGLMGVVEAVKLASPSEGFAFQIMKPVSERMVQEGVVRAEGLRKTASMKLVNQKHPMILAFHEIMKTAHNKVHSKAALDEANKAYEKTAAFLKKHIQ